MNRSKVILRIAALWMLMLFMLSITPRFYLHDLFTDHTEISYCSEPPRSGPCIHQQGYNCPLFDLILPHEYELNGQHRVASIIKYISTFTPPFISYINSREIYGRAGRGPPAHV